MPLTDSFGRDIYYLRVSVTDRCNFRCVYCMPEEGAPVSPKGEILSFEEIERAVRIAAGLGIRKVRLTGGEPFARRDVISLVRSIAAIPGIEETSITTNGSTLDRCAGELAAAGLTRVNISLDTLRPERFTSIARRGDFHSVWSGILAAQGAGLTPIKLNCVVMRGYNFDEVGDFAALTQEHAWDVRFIELMPINWYTGDDSVRSGSLADLAAAPGYRSSGSVPLYALETESSFVAAFHESGSAGRMLNGAELRRAFVGVADIRSAVEARIGGLEPSTVATNGPARSFRAPGSPGTVSFISQITNDMCAGCNRIRLTADGQIRPCLMADGEIDLKTPMRAGASNSAIAELFLTAVRHKPYEHRIEDGHAPVGRTMSQMGG